MSQEYSSVNHSFNDTGVSELDLFKARLRLIGNGYILFVLCVAGIIGNILAFITFTTKSVRTSTISIHLRTLACADIFVLITAIFRHKTYNIFLSEEQQIKSVFYFDPYIQVYVEPFHWIALGVSSFITVALSLERYLAVKYPVVVKKSCTPFIVRICTILIMTAVIALTLPNFFIYTVHEFDLGGFLTVIVAERTQFGKDSKYPCKFHNYIVPIIWYIIPWVVLAVTNTLLSHHVHKSTRIRVGLQGIRNPNRNLSTVIILIVFVYMLCNFPKSILVCYKTINQITDINMCMFHTTELTSQQSKEYEVVELLADLLNILNSCMNIVVYCLVGTQFRRELKRLLRCRKKSTLTVSSRVSPLNIITNDNVTTTSY